MIVKSMKASKAAFLDLRDGIFLLGAGAAVYGTSMLNIPAAWILGGAIVMYLAYASAPVEEDAQEMEVVPAPKVVNR